MPACTCWRICSGLRPRAAGALGFQEGVNGYSGTTDAYINRWAATTNYGNATTFSVRYNDEHAGLVRFDLAALAPGSTVTAATLELYVVSSGNSNHLQVDAYQLLHAWGESSVTWNTPWSSPGANAVGADRAATPAASALVTPNDVGRWITLDLRALVQGWVNAPGTNHGVLLRATAAIPNGGIVTYSFAASEYSETARRPMRGSRRSPSGGRSGCSR